jgi:hypothetical protein
MNMCIGVKCENVPEYRAQLAERNAVTPYVNWLG